MRQLSLFGRYTWFYSPKFIVTICLTLSFYQVVNAFDQEQKRALLRFVTSCSRPPLLFVVFLFKSKSADRIVTSLLQWLQRTCSQLLHPRCRERSISSSNLQHMRQSFKSKFYHSELRMHFSPLAISSFLYTRVSGHYVSNFCRRSIRELDSTCLEALFFFRFLARCS